jgi:amidase
VSDAVYVLDAIVGFDPRDSEATTKAAEFIPAGGYKQFLKKDGLKGKRVGIVRNPFLDSFNDSTVISTFNHHLEVLRLVSSNNDDKYYQHGQITHINLTLHLCLNLTWIL